MAAICADSIKICALRVTALDSLGNVAAGPNNYVTTDRLVQLQYTGDVDQGKDLFYRNGCDQAQAVYKSPPLLKRFNLQLDTFGIEPALKSILLGAPIIDDNSGSPVGFEYAIQTCPTDPQPPYVAVEAWAWSWNCDAQLPATPYVYYLWPMMVWSEDQADTLQADVLQPKLSGFTRKNPLWGHGPYGGIVKGAAGNDTFETSTGGMAVMFTSTPPPTAVCGFSTVTPGS